MELIILKYAICILSQLTGIYILSGIISGTGKWAEENSVENFTDFMESYFLYFIGVLLSLCLIVIPMFFYI